MSALIKIIHWVRTLFTKVCISLNYTQVCQVYRSWIILCHSLSPSNPFRWCSTWWISHSIFSRETPAFLSSKQFELSEQNKFWMHHFVNLVSESISVSYIFFHSHHFFRWCSTWWISHSSSSTSLPSTMSLWIWGSWSLNKWREGVSDLCYSIRLYRNGRGKGIFRTIFN